MTNSFSHVEATQAKWALDAGIPLQRPGYVAVLADNLVPNGLHQETLAEFAKADGAELRDSGSRPAKMRALVSSSALAANFFDNWRHVPKDPLVTALNLKQPITALRFEYKCKDYPVGPGSPNLDLLLTLADGERIGIESKFVEPYRSPGVDSAISLKYFPPGSQQGHWSGVGLENAQLLVNEMRGRWDYLDTPQILKHLLGLRSEKPKATTRLVYLWFETRLADAAAHRGEIARFGELIQNDDVVFFAMSYQELFDRLMQSNTQPTPEWGAYLRQRYFPVPEAV
jgi:hypothetical protein